MYLRIQGVYKMMNQAISNKNIFIDSTAKSKGKKLEKLSMDKKAVTNCMLSIIVPVYNTEKYIKNCLESLLNQDIDKSMYEIICINDGSTDGSLMILQEYVKKYDNIILIDKENEGVSIARNVGMEKAKGDYVWFIDADDWIARECLGVIKQEIKKTNPSVLQIDFDWIKAEWRVAQCKNAILNKEKVKCSVHGVSVFDYVGAWSFIIKKDILICYEHRFIEHLHYGEDILFIRELFDRMRMEIEDHNIVHTIIHCQGDIFYYYRLHDESACRSSWTKNRIKYMDALLKMARINKKRMNDTSKPEWYNEQYMELFYKRMHNYMMDWLPGGNVNLKHHLEELKSEQLYPCPKPPKKVYRKLIETDGGVISKIKIIYKYLAFRWKWLYPLYYRQMRSKYLKDMKLNTTK